MFRINCLILCGLAAPCVVALQSVANIVHAPTGSNEHHLAHHDQYHWADEALVAKTLAGEKAGLPTLPPVPVTGAPHTAAEASGVAGNGAVDGYAFITATITNVIVMCVCVGIFMCLRQKFPQFYQNNLQWDKNGKYIGFAPTQALGPNPDDQAQIEEALMSRWGWWTASMNTTTEEVAEGAGLDMAMLLEFTNLGMSMLKWIGLPMCLIIGPMNCAFGGQPAWAIGDYLSSLSFGNVENGSKLYWVHAFVVWYVVIVVQTSLYAAQAKFIKLRFAWLHKMAPIRANTILVEGIPDAFRSSGKTREFFEQIFGKSAVASTYEVRSTSELDPLVDQHKAAVEKLKETHTIWKQAIEAQPDANPEDLRPRKFMKGDLITYFESIRDDAKAKINDQKEKIKGGAARDGQEKQTESVSGMSAGLAMIPADDHCEPGDMCWSGFVTFTETKYAQMAVTQLYSSDKDTWVVSCPPEPMDLIWKDIQLSPKKGTAAIVFGYGLVVGLYLIYLPLVIGIAQLAVSIDMGPLEAVWIGLAPTLGLQVMVAFLPTILLLIFRSFWILKADTLAQKRLQTYYFWFQIVFVVLVTAIGSDAVGFTTTVFTDPLALPDLLGAAMPPATHFYMNFLVLQWVTHAQGLMRHVMLLKFLSFKQIMPEEDALKMAEPEDQDYYGIGSRSARFTINMVLGIVYGTLCPPINFLCWANFFFCRLFYGYLIPFAETKKPDLGGEFWVEQLKHLFVGNILYCIVMCGVLSLRAEMDGFQPVTIAAPSLIYVLWSYARFQRAFSWESLPIPALVGGDQKQYENQLRTLEGKYEQRSLAYDPEEEEKQK